MRTIFVSIASYRDPDVSNTVSDLLLKAKHRDRVHIGVFLQVDSILDKDCFITPQKNVRMMMVDPSIAKGAGWARAKIQESLYDNEDFFFQVDSHMRFEQDWDETLTTMYDSLPENAVISTYPLPFTPPMTFNPPRMVRINAKKFDVDGVMLQSSGLFSFVDSPERTPFISAGMYFVPRKVISDVPIDKHIYFTGEEITTALRLFTHGYDVYIPNKVIAYHNYNLAPERPRIWSDQGERTSNNILSRERVLYLCGQKDTGSKDALQNLEQYRLGCKRTISEFEEFAGINFKERTIKSTCSTT